MYNVYLIARLQHTTQQTIPIPIAAIVVRLAAIVVRLG